MQNLGLSGPTLKTESRFKSLFWPAIEFDTDIDEICRQGFWVCIIVAAVTFVVSCLRRDYLGGSIAGMFFVLGGFGSRQRSKVAASVIFTVYVFSALSGMRQGVRGFSVVTIIIGGLLLGNLRAAWLAARLQTTPTVAATPTDPVIETFSDKFADRLPAFLWPKLKWLFYILAFIILLGVVAALFQPPANPVR